MGKQETCSSKDVSGIKKKSEKKLNELLRIRKQQKTVSNKTNTNLRKIK
jgi:hypothetical protein